MTEVKTKSRRARVWRSVRWWTRWWLRYFPMLAFRRITCDHTDRYDEFCMHCAAPWFWYDRT